MTAFFEKSHKNTRTPKMLGWDSKERSGRVDKKSGPALKQDHPSITSSSIMTAKPRTIPIVAK